MKHEQPNASHLYEAERRVEHAARPGFRILELQLSPTQKVPWHNHSNVPETLYVLDGHMWPQFRARQQIAVALAVIGHSNRDIDPCPVERAG